MNWRKISGDEIPSGVQWVRESGTSRPVVPGTQAGGFDVHVLYVSACGGFRREEYSPNRGDDTITFYRPETETERNHREKWESRSADEE